MKRKPVKNSDSVMVYCGFTKLADPTKLKPHPENTRIHPKAQLALLAEIIEGTGWRETITVSKRSGFVTRGHARLAASLAKGWTEVPVDEQNYASAEAELADLVADTRIKEFSNLDDGKLRSLVVRMKDTGGNLRMTALDTNVIDTILRDYESSLRMQMITPETGNTGDTIRQVILIFDDNGMKRFADAATAISTKRNAESVSQLLLELLREKHANSDHRTAQG